MTELLRTDYLIHRDVAVAITYIDEGPPLVGVYVHAGNVPEPVARLRALSNAVAQRHDSAVLNELLPCEVDDGR